MAHSRNNLARHTLAKVRAVRLNEAASKADDPSEGIVPVFGDPKECRKNAHTSLQLEVSRACFSRDFLNLARRNAQWPVNHPKARRLRSSGQKTAMMELTTLFQEWLIAFEKTQSATGDEETVALLALSRIEFAHRNDTGRGAAWAGGKAWARSLPAHAK